MHAEMSLHPFLHLSSQDYISVEVERPAFEKLLCWQWPRESKIFKRQLHVHVSLAKQSLSLFPALSLPSASSAPSSSLTPSLCLE